MRKIRDYVLSGKEAFVGREDSMGSWIVRVGSGSASPTR
jgi:hypothetical protein